MVILRRSSWLIATLTALFGLQAPLCALACLDLSDSTPVAAQGGEPPCHESSTDPSPTGAPGSHEGCGCESAYEALLPGTGSDLSSVSTLAFAPPGTLPYPADSSAAIALPVPQVTDLPPPDILLIKSTLLI